MVAVQGRCLANGRKWLGWESLVLYNAHASFLPSVVLVDRKIINSIHKKISPGCNSRDCHIVFP